MRAERSTIAQVGDPVLRQRARALSPDEIRSREIRQLIGKMRKTMHDAPGVGLAAPQIGIPVQLAVIEDREEYLEEIPDEQLTERERLPIPFQVLINPTIHELAGESVEFYEGCLSLAGFTALVPRARRVRVQCLDEHGKRKSIEASGWYARILQHEIDHLHGRLYVDHMHSRTFASLDNFNRFWKGKSIADVRAALKP